MPGLGLAQGYGAAAGGAALSDIIKQRLAEVVAQQENEAKSAQLAQQGSQFDRRLAFDESVAAAKPQGDFGFGTDPALNDKNEAVLPVINKHSGEVTLGPKAAQKPRTSVKTFKEVPQGVDVDGQPKPIPAVYDDEDAVYRDMSPEHKIIPGARAHREPYQGIPIVAMQGPEGPGAFNKKTNTFTPAINAETGEKVGRPVPAAMADKASGIEQSIGILQKLIATPKDKIIGPLQGRLRDFGTMVPGYETPSDVSDFIADTNTLTNSIIKAITGAQMSEVEAKRIKGQIPLITDQGTVWESKAHKTIENLSLLHDRMLALAGTPKSLAQPQGATPAPTGGVPDDIGAALKGKRAGSIAKVNPGTPNEEQWQIDAKGVISRIK